MRKRPIREVSEQSKEKMRQAHLGKKHSKLTKQKIGQANKGRRRDELWS